MYDFLFTYYGFRPAWLRRWHPGPDVVLGGAGAREFLRWPEYRMLSAAEGAGPVAGLRPGGLGTISEATDAFTDRPPADGVVLDRTALPPNRHEFVGWLRRLLVAMQSRPAFFGCFGLHEWAMVYRQTAAELRHNAWPLRFAPDELARTVERSSICCSHHDAFRFFTGPARPLNRLQPGRSDMVQFEQRGCLHANMDLYKWAFKLAPFTPAELVADCFELARDIREVDMRASPYDLRALGFAPIPIETPAGRAAYEQHQREFAARGEPLRARLVAVCDWLAPTGVTDY